MQNKFFVRMICVMMILVFFSSCAMSTQMKIDVTDTNGMPVNNAAVFVNGEMAGQTPGARKKVSNFVGSNTEITVSKEGYQTTRTNAAKQVKVINVIGGILLLLPWLWVYGPKAQQNVVLTPEPGGSQ